MFQIVTRRAPPKPRKHACAEQAQAARGESEEQAFYAAQAEAFNDLRAYHAARPRRRR